MKKIHSFINSIIMIAFVALCTSAIVSDEVITKEGNATVINTTTLTKSIIGYQSPTPVKIYIEGDKITKVSALRNTETLKWFRGGQQLYPYL